MFGDLDSFEECWSFVESPLTEIQPKFFFIIRLGLWVLGRKDQRGEVSCLAHTTDALSACIRPAADHDWPAEGVSARLPTAKYFLPSLQSASEGSHDAQPTLKDGELHSASWRAEDRHQLFRTFCPGLSTLPIYLLNRMNSAIYFGLWVIINTTSFHYKLHFLVQHRLLGTLSGGSRVPLTYTIFTLN